MTQRKVELSEDSVGHLVDALEMLDMYRDQIGFATGSRVLQRAAHALCEDLEVMRGVRTESQRELTK